MTQKPLCGDDAGLNLNPDRGFRLEVAFRKYDDLKKAADILDYHLKNSEPEQITLAQTYIYLAESLTCDIPESALEAIGEVFEVYRKKSVKMLLRFAYELKFRIGGATTEIILRHIDQLAPVVHRNSDVIYALQTGFIGAWGEWHNDIPRVDRKKVVTAVAEKLAAPETYMQTRLPVQKNFISPSHPKYNMIGFHNDCFYGIANSFDIGSCGLDPGYPQWYQAAAQSPYAPQDAELYWSGWCIDNDRFCDGYDALMALSELHMTSLSAAHGYTDRRSDPEHTVAMERWKKQPLTPEWLDEHHIPYELSWFEGAANRNVFEFIRDHLGYRLRLCEYSAKEVGNGALDIRLTLVNYGFSSPFNLSGELALLDDGGNVVSSFALDGIERWYPASVEPQITLHATLIKPEGLFKWRIDSDEPAFPPEEGAIVKPYGGKYRVGIRLHGTLGDNVRFDNDAEYEDGFCILQ